MKKSVITKGGLQQLARIFVSCKPIMGAILTANQLALIEQAGKKEDVIFDNFTQGLPLADPTYDQILAFAHSMNHVHIDETVVWKFFGGKPHFDKILGQIHENKLKKDFAQRIFFAHMLIPVTLTAVHKDAHPECLARFEGEYRNGNVVVKIKNLIASPTLGKLALGTMVLAHYATIVSDHAPQEIVAYLIDIQAKKKEFLKACEYVKSIDYDDFWNLCQWTEEMIKERKL